MSINLLSVFVGSVIDLEAPSVKYTEVYNQAGEIVWEGPMLFGHGGGPKTNAVLEEAYQAFLERQRQNYGTPKPHLILSCGYNTLPAYMQENHIQKMIGIPEGEGRFISVYIKLRYASGNGCCYDICKVEWV